MSVKVTGKCSRVQPHGLYDVIMLIWNRFKLQGPGRLSTLKTQLTGSGAARQLCFVFSSSHFDADESQQPESDAGSEPGSDVTAAELELTANDCQSKPLFTDTDQRNGPHRCSTEQSRSR